MLRTSNLIGLSLLSERIMIDSKWFIVLVGVVVCACIVTLLTVIVVGLTRVL